MNQFQKNTIRSGASPIARMQRAGARVVVPRPNHMRMAGFGDASGGLFSTAGSAVAKFLPAGSQAQKSVSLTATGAGIGTAIFPGLGTAIGAAIGAIGSLFGPSKEGQAELTWDNMVNQGYLLNKPGHEFDERYWAEAMKGMTDKNTATFPGTGKSDHTNPDILMAALAQTVIQGYLNRVVPLSATPDQVYVSVVVPWLQSGGNGHVNWASLQNLAKRQGRPRSLQELMLLSAVDRYLYGQPITRANMPSYASLKSNYAPWSTPDILTALASIIPKAAPTPASPPPAAPQASVLPVPVASAPASIAPVTSVPQVSVPVTTAAGTVQATVPAPTVNAAGGVDVSALVQQLMAQGASQQQAFTSAIAALNAQGVATPPPVQAQVAQQVAQTPVATAGLSDSKSLWIAGGLAVLGVMFALARPKSGQSSKSALSLS